MSQLTRGVLLAHLQDHVFTPGPVASLGRRRIGAEVELIPVETDTGRRCPLSDPAVPATLPFIRRFAARHGWTEESSPKGTSCFLVRPGGTVTFEPGGQIEYSSPPSRSLSTLIHRLRSVVLPLRSAAAAEGITLLSVGIDPCTPVEQVPLQVAAERYRRMAEHFARIGPSGAKMMRQTAAFQVSLDFEHDAEHRWRALNAVTPYITAMFASSACYEGRDTGHRSFRAHVWRTLDPRRTGLPYDERHPVEAYLDFALGAPAILLPTVGSECLPFGEWLRLANPTLDEWTTHLTTLFPEIRPRGHLEVRSADAVDPAWYTAPLALLAGLVYEPRALRAALDILPAPDLGLLARAGRLGLQDPGIARTAADLCDIALAGCTRLGSRFLHPAHLDEARAYFETYTRLGRSPADDAPRIAVAA